MGKVYDALRRAEQQRTRGAGEPPAAAAPSALERPSPARAPREPFWKRWFRGAPSYVESADAANKRRISLLQPDSFVAEQFRTLRTRLDSIGAQRPLHTIAVTSAVKGEGKSTTAINLAIVMSLQIERRPLLVDCDLRKPKIHRSFGLNPEAGLAEVLTGEAPIEKAICKVEGLSLEVLPVRGLPANASELLASGRMRSLLEELTRTYDPVILDVPATLGLPDAKTVSELVDGVLVVVRAESTPQEEIEQALDVLDRRRVLGLVLNDAHLDVGKLDYRR